LPGIALWAKTGTDSPTAATAKWGKREGQYEDKERKDKVEDEGEAEKVEEGK
jgi:hypothetical protein